MVQAHGQELPIAEGKVEGDHVTFPVTLIPMGMM
jgi:hypothetical protein